MGKCWDSTWFLAQELYLWEKFSQKVQWNFPSRWSFLTNWSNSFGSWNVQPVWKNNEYEKNIQFSLIYLIENKIVYWIHLSFITNILSVLWVVLPRSVQVESCLSAKCHVTLITWVAEHIREMLALHMVSCTGTNLVRKFAAHCTVELLVKWVLFHKLKKFTRILEIVS